MAQALTLTSALSYASNALADLGNQFIQMKLGMSTLQRGYLSSYLIPPNIVMEIIKEIQSRSLKTLFPPIESYLSIYYKFIKVIHEFAN